MSAFFFWFFFVLFMILSVVLVLLILIQKGKGGGLSSAFGGAGGNTAFGQKTGDVLTWATSIIFGIFLLLAIALNMLANARQAAAKTIAGPAVVKPVGPTNAPAAIPVTSATQPTQ